MVHLPLLYHQLKIYALLVRRTMLVKNQILCSITSCEMVNSNRRFGRDFWHHFQGLCSPKEVLFVRLIPRLQNLQTFLSGWCVDMTSSRIALESFSEMSKNVNTIFV